MCMLAEAPGAVDYARHGNSASGDHHLLLLSWAGALLEIMHEKLGQAGVMPLSLDRVLFIDEKLCDNLHARIQLS